MRLTDFYANAPVCTPSRAALMSGRYQQRVMLERPPDAVRDKEIGLTPTGRSPTPGSKGSTCCRCSKAPRLRWSGERNEVAYAHPEIVRRLKGQIEAWEKDVDAEASPLQKPARK